MDIISAREKLDQIDAAMREAFIARMNVVAEVAQYKKEHDLPIFDPIREEAMKQKNGDLIENSALRAHYIEFLTSLLTISKAYQSEILGEGK